MKKSLGCHKLSVSLALSLCLLFISSPNVFAQDYEELNEDLMIASENNNSLDDMIRRIEAEEDGDDDVPTKTPKAKVYPKKLSTYGFRQALRWKLSKDSFFEAYADQGIGAQDTPYKTPSSKLSIGGTGSFLFNGFVLTPGLDIKRNYTGVIDNWDYKLDRTYSLAVARKVKLSDKWSVNPAIKETSIVSDLQTKNLLKTDVTLPFSYELNKKWTVKALTVAYSTQTFSNRVLSQTDTTWSASTGIAYKVTPKSTVDLTVSREERYSNQSSAEYARTTIIPKYDYKYSSTSSIGLAIGYETHSTNTAQFSRWLIIPKVQMRWDM